MILKVSWIRKRDSLVLSIDRLKLIEDPRFQLAQSEHNWTLVLRQPTNEDAGEFKLRLGAQIKRRYLLTSLSFRLLRVPGLVGGSGANLARGAAHGGGELANWQLQLHVCPA